MVLKVLAVSKRREIKIKRVSTRCVMPHITYISYNMWRAISWEKSLGVGIDEMVFT